MYKDIPPIIEGNQRNGLQESGIQRPRKIDPIID